MAQPYLACQIDLSERNTVAAYDELPLWSSRFGHALLDRLVFKPGMTVLDVGCGAGFPTLELAERLGRSCHVHGVDPWEQALDRARFKAAHWGIANVSFHCADAAALPFPDAGVDLIVSNLGINNFEQPAAVLKECRRVLKPGGHLVITTNLKGHMREFYAVFEQVLRQLGDAEGLQALEQHVDARRTLEQATELIVRAGFQVETAEVEHFLMRFLDGSALLNHHFIRLGFLDNWKKVSKRSPEVVFAALEEELNRLAGEQGELRLTIPLAYLSAM